MVSDIMMMYGVWSHLGREEVELYVRVRHPGPAPDEAPGLQVGGAGGPRPVKEPLDPHLEVTTNVIINTKTVLMSYLDHPQSSLVTQQRDRLLTFLHHVDLKNDNCQFVELGNNKGLGFTKDYEYLSRFIAARIQH